MPFKVYTSDEAKLEAKLNEIQESGENVVQVVLMVWQDAESAYFKIISLSMAPWKPKQEPESQKQ